MDDEKVKKRIGANIAYYRRRAGLTQAGLAEKLNYSDKAVSKWERGDSIPDVLTLIQIAAQFGVTVDALLGDVNALPEKLGTLERAMNQVSEKALKRKANKNIILALLSTLDIAHSALAFLYAVPANAIVLLSLRSAWHDFRWNKALISAIMWGSLASIHASICAFVSFNAWKILLLGIPGQIAIFLWFRMFQHPKEEDHE